MIVIWGLAGVKITVYLFSLGIHLNHLNMLFDFCTFWEQSLNRGGIRHCLMALQVFIGLHDQIVCFYLYFEISEILDVPTLGKFDRVHFNSFV